MPNPPAMITDTISAQRKVSAKAIARVRKNGYEQGYNDGLNRKPKDISRWTIGDAAALREGLTNTNK